MSISLSTLADRLHIWYFDLDRSESELMHLRTWLNAAELAKVARLVSPQGRARQVAIRGCLRSILSRYLDIDPAQVEFEFGDYGKPFVPQSQLEFNLSHAHNLGVCAVCLSSPVGIDIEYVRPIEAEQLVDRFFSDIEKVSFQRLPESERLSGFFSAWTQKEAYLKAIGTGLSLSLDRVEVCIDPRLPPAIAHISGYQIERLAHLPPNYIGTAIVQGKYQEICYQWLNYPDG
jgi:4'-phosphopantetheinyl transferase